MLDDLAVCIEAEDVDACVVVIAGPVLEAVQHHQVTLGHAATELDTLAWVLLCHAVEVVDEGLLAITNAGIVLDVLAPPYRSIASAGRHSLNMSS